MLLQSFGGTPSGAGLERILKSSQYRNGEFVNLEETRAIAEGVSYFKMFTEYFGKGVNREPGNDLPSVKTNLRSLPPDKAVIVWFGHSSYLMSVKGIKILVDPVFSQRASPVQYAGSKSYPGTMVYDTSDLPDLDVIVITHDHYDHLDHHTITKLKDRAKIFCTPLGVGSHLVQWGVDAARIKEFDWWQQEIVLTGIDLTATPARHFSGRSLRRNKTLWASFVLRTGGYNIFIGGDSGYDAAFKTIGEQFGAFDIAMLECGQYDVQWPFIHMMPEETVQASLDLRAKVLLPVHWGKFTLALHAWNDPVKRAVKQAAALHATITTPKIGEPVVLGEGLPAQRWWEG